MQCLSGFGRNAPCWSGGIRQKIDPTISGFGPIDQNIFAWTDEQRSKIKAPPSSLNEALRALEADHKFLTSNGVFTDELLTQWVDFKRDQEPMRFAIDLILMK
jgi:glutamine synthetase